MGGFESKDGLCSCGDGALSSAGRGRRSINVESRSDLEREGPDYIEHTGPSASPAPPVVLMVPTKMGRDGESVIDEEALGMMVAKYNESMKKRGPSGSQVSERSISTRSDITVSTAAYEESVAAAEDVNDALNFLGNLESGGTSAAVAALEAGSAMNPLLSTSVMSAEGGRSSGTPTSDDDPAFEAILEHRQHQYLQRVATPPMGTADALGLPMHQHPVRSHSTPALFGGGGKALEVLMGIESSADESSAEARGGLPSTIITTLPDGSQSVGVSIDRSMTMPPGVVRPFETRTPVMDSSGQYGFPGGFTHTATPKQGVRFGTEVVSGTVGDESGIAGSAGSPASQQSSVNSGPPLPTKSRSTASLDFSAADAQQQQRSGQSQSVVAQAVRRVGSDPATLDDVGPPTSMDRSLSFTPGVPRRQSEPRKSVFKPSDLHTGVSARQWTTKKFKKEEFAMAEALARMGGGSIPMADESDDSSSEEDSEESESEEESESSEDESDSEEDRERREMEAMKRAMMAGGAISMGSGKSKKSSKKKKRGRSKSRVKRQRSTIVKPDVEDVSLEKVRGGGGGAGSSSDGAVSEEEDYEYE